MRKEEALSQIGSILDQIIAANGISPDQEVADIAAAVQPFRDQLAALQVDDDQKTALVASLQDVIAKVRAAVA